MMNFFQGDIIKIEGYSKQFFIIVSKNAFIKSTGVFHVSPLIKNASPGPIHIAVSGENGTSGVVACEQIKIIDPQMRGCLKVDSLPYIEKMEVSDAIQGIFEYD